RLSSIVSFGCSALFFKTIFFNKSEGFICTRYRCRTEICQEKRDWSSLSSAFLELIPVCPSPSPSSLLPIFLFPPKSSNASDPTKGSPISATTVYKVTRTHRGVPIYAYSYVSTDKNWRQTTLSSIIYKDHVY
ncbi:mCG146171, partial [Mus musculus]